jgi:hypothetical protein
MLCTPLASPPLAPAVLINKASFVWKDLAEATSTRRGQNTRRAARKHSTDAETQDAQESATTDSAAATDSIADSPGAGTVGTASTTGGTVEYRAALRAAAAAGMPSSTASRIRMANPDNAATLGANEATVQVAAAAPAAATSADAAAGATAATPAGDAEKAKAAYDKNEPGLADPEFLLPVGPEVSGEMKHTGSARTCARPRGGATHMQRGVCLGRECFDKGVPRGVRGYRVLTRLGAVLLILCFRCLSAWRR